MREKSFRILTKPAQNAIKRYGPRHASATSPTVALYGQVYTLGNAVHCRHSDSDGISGVLLFYIFTRECNGERDIHERNVGTASTRLTNSRGLILNPDRAPGVMSLTFRLFLILDRRVSDYKLSDH